MKNINKYFLAASILILLLSVAITWAIAQDDNPTYYACVHREVGGIRMVNLEDDCRVYEYKIEWNMQGPPGAPGGQIGEYSFICGGCYLRGIDLSELDLSNSWLYSADLRDANLENTNFVGANLQSVSLSQWFDRVLIEGANVQEIRIDQADLSGSDFHEFDLQSAGFYECNLENSDFSWSNLVSATFGSSNLALADFSNANLYNAILWYADGIGSIVWNNTTCPDGTNSDNNVPATCEGHLEPWGPYPYPSPYPYPYPAP